MKALIEEDDDTDPRNTSVSSDRTLEPTPITEQSLSEVSTLLGCTPTEVRTAGSDPCRIDRIAARHVMTVFQVAPGAEVTLVNSRN